jgi:hypothetical protein
VKGLRYALVAVLLAVTASVSIVSRAEGGTLPALGTGGAGRQEAGTRLKSEAATPTRLRQSLAASPATLQIPTANRVTFGDPPGDSGNAVDITVITVSNDDAGTLTFEVDIGNQASMLVGDGVDVYIDSVANAGDPASANADYQLQSWVEANGFFRDLCRWEGTWNCNIPIGSLGVRSDPLGSSSFRLTFTVNRSDVGTPSVMNFWVLSEYPYTSSTPDRDLAPDGLSVFPYQVVIDVAPPETTIASGPPAVTASTTATFTFSATEAGSTFQCSVDGTAFVACASPHSYTVGPGSHGFSVRATDPAGNVDQTSATYTWFVDTTPPETTIAVGPDARTEGRDATFTFTANEPGSTFQCSLDGAAFAACMSPVSYSGQALGTRRFQVRAIDPVGNVDPTPASHSWTVVRPPRCRTRLDPQVKSKAALVGNRIRLLKVWVADVPPGTVATFSAGGMTDRRVANRHRVAVSTKFKRRLFRRGRAWGRISVRRGGCSTVVRVRVDRDGLLQAI